MQYLPVNEKLLRYQERKTCEKKAKRDEIDDRNRKKHPTVYPSSGVSGRAL